MKTTCSGVMATALLLLLSVTTTTVVKAQDNENNNNSNNNASLYFCDDPEGSSSNVLECDEDTLRWKLEMLDPWQPVDESQVCAELMEILVEARADSKERFDELVETLVSDALKPCVLWHLRYGELADENYGTLDPTEEEGATVVPDHEQGA